MATDWVQVPPIRTNLNDPNMTAQTAKEWYLYWKRSGDRINVFNRMIGVGTHAGRPDPATAPEGALYVENDRGNVLYQNIAGVWNYIAGTMWGTLVPDQRPTDLGVRDAGFDFRTTVAPPREFLWSGTAWVEVASQTGDVQIAYASGDLTLTTSFQVVPGTTLTLARAGRYLIHGIFFFVFTSADGGGNYLLGTILGLGNQAIFVAPALGGSSLQATISQQWVVTVSTSSTPVSLQARKSGGTGSSYAGAAHSSISATWISS